MSLFGIVPLVVLLPLAGLLVNLLFGRRLGERFTAWVACSAAGLAFGAAAVLAWALAQQPQGAVVPLASWVQVGALDVPWAFRVDTLSVTMMLVVAGVGTLIHIYAAGYMHEDVRLNEDPGRYTRFFIYFNLFLASMLVLVSGDSFLTLFVGWEGVGLCSYLLISFWYEKGKDGIGNALAGKKAFIANRIGDAGFLIAILLIYTNFGSLSFDAVFARVEEFGPAIAPLATLITLCLLVGATGKSAQIPLFVWLPDAMAGPTPVSALIHAATMVTAGIYMLTRSHALLALAPFTQNAVAVVGAATALFAATIAVAQNDIKKVLAYSTISQLGFMVAAVGMGAYVAGMFHLVSHAFFKALLFLSAGSVILGLEAGHHHAVPGMHAVEPFDPQDMRNMGGLWQRMPVTRWVYLIGAIALAGLPPLAGFFSKDEIMADAFQRAPGIYVTLSAAAFLTAFYMTRQVWLVFFGQPRSAAAADARENPPIITAPLVALAGLSILGGALNLPGLHTLTTWLGYTLGEAEAGEFNLLVAGLSTALALGAIAMAAGLYRARPVAPGATDPLRAFLGPLHRGLEAKWWVDEIYDALIVRPYVWVSARTAEVIEMRFWHDFVHERVLAGGFATLTNILAWRIDISLVDGFFNGLARGVQGLGEGLRKLQVGYVRAYATVFLLGVVAALGYILIGLR
jgi:NADH-quinone oxidoreductase subunit L